MNQLDLFSSEESENRKASGMEIAASRNTDLQIARDIAKELCIKNGETEADSVGKVLFDRHGISTLGPAAGSIFAGNEFEFTGQFVKSVRKSNHSRLLRIWKLRSN